MLFTAIAGVVILQALAGVISAQKCTSILPKDNYTKVFGNKCYRFVINDALDYDKANSKCADDFAGILASVTSEALDKFLYDVLSKLHVHDQVWIGLNDIKDENEFKWEDGSLFNYSNWADENEGPRGGFSHLLSHHLEDCVALDMESDGKWRDYSCSSKLLVADERKAFICQVE